MKTNFTFIKLIKLFVLFILIAFSSTIQAQNPKGKLFIIGGGKRSDQLMSQLLTISSLQKKDYIVVLPMSSEEPDSSYIFF